MRKLLRRVKEWWGRKRGKRQRALPKGFLSHEIVVKFSELEAITLQLWTERQSKTVPLWLRERAMEAVPLEFRKQIREALKGVAIESEALSDLNLDADAGREDQELKPKKQDPRDNPQYQELLQFPRAKDHSCYHLRAAFLGHLKAGECQGTCASPDPAATGRICHFSSATAPHCPYYEPTAIERKRLAKRSPART